METVAKKALPPRHVVRTTGLHVQAKPWVAMSLIVMAASAERMAVHLTGHDRQVALATASGAFVVAVVWASRSRRRLMSKHLRRRFLAALYAGAAWLAYVAYAGLSWGATGTLMAVGATLSLLYWRVHRIEAPPNRMSLPQVGEQDMFVDRWAEHLGAKDGQLNGSRLTNCEIIKSGYRYTLRLVPGKQNVAGVIGMTEILRSGLQLLPGQEVIVEPHTTLPAPNALLTIVTRSTVLSDQEWPGPENAFDPVTGSVKMGPFVDGEGVACWLVYPKDGMFGGFMQGKPGSGKSRLLETIACSMASSLSHPTVVWFACGQEGASSKLLRERADNVALSGDEFLEMLIMAEKTMKVNTAENQMWGLDGFAPGRQTVRENGVEKEIVRRGLLIIADEFHNFTGRKRYNRADEVQERMTRIAREGRKAGVAIIAATQDPLLSAFGEGKHGDLLRSCLLGGNGVLLQSETSNAKVVFNVDVNPRQFPRLPGYGFLARPQDGARSAPFRAYFVNDRAVSVWLRTIVWLDLSRRHATYCGRPYAARKMKADVRKEQTESFLALLDTGLFEDLDDVGAEMDQIEQQSRVDHSDILSTRFPRARRFWQEYGDQLTEGQEKVLAAVRQGDRKPSEIQQSTGYGQTHVRNMLTELMGLEKVEKVDYGHYRAVA